MMLLKAAALAALMATGAAAQDFSGAAALARGDYAAAERAIAAQQRLFPRDADLLINLAQVYARTGRTAEAARLYREVAAQPDDALDLPDGRVASSHALAGKGLQRLTVALAAR